MRANFQRYLDDKITEIFLEVLKTPMEQEFLSFTSAKKSTKNEEKYDSIGNLSPAEEKVEGGSIHYEQTSQMFQTTVINKTYDRGYYETLEATEDDVERVINKVKDSGIMQAMVAKREMEAAAIVDAVFTSVSADGTFYASATHPLDTTKTAAVNDNLMAAGAITPTSIIDGCNKFHSIKNYAGIPFRTKANAILAHVNMGSVIKSVLESNLRAQELSNTKNTVPALTPILSTYISEHPWHLLDRNIDSFIFQRRSDLRKTSKWDETDTLNYYWAAFERYRAAQINPGFGHVSNAYAG
jgi:hypothetical protein